ncbi:cytochrome c/c1 heme lyase, putative [Babesia bigemina]|uniref:Holocytochrome c-type synthase n=1 Tax=Babesia bigemina TaxID=5866 RepID=A0A061D2N7_BABBI|nr:cytochrome c/c1 heme lyase, putative [Babesia bigemina]CDR94327.1 cytochrome c/c1 heme lyase, putative [Babesia bigemina]|eukprot:XP_012766513.1 cytochrome c/c1 heme lyase, putative [Babesia bigemina]
MASRASANITEEPAGAPSCPIEGQFSDEKKLTKSSCSSSQTGDSVITLITKAEVKDLNATRTQSNIPGKNSNWIYPSERQFYRSTLAKGHRVDATVIPTVVQIHNAINEKAWERIMEYEDMHYDRCQKPVLAHFIGKKDQLTLRARLRHLMGYKLPYDRHDWTVDRCGKLVRYIIDFYEGRAPNDEPIAVYMDVRPELSMGGIVDRCRLWLKRNLW